jgi:hypothetical protein
VPCPVRVMENRHTFQAKLRRFKTLLQFLPKSPVEGVPFNAQFRTTQYPPSTTHYFYVASPRIRLALAANLDLTLVVSALFGASTVGVTARSAGLKTAATFGGKIMRP